MTIEVGRYEEAALLKALGIPFAGAELIGRRVIMRFDDALGDGKRILAEHTRQGVSVNSQDFESGLQWAKGVIFGTRKD